MSSVKEQPLLSGEAVCGLEWSTHFGKPAALRDAGGSRWDFQSLWVVLLPV